MSAINNISYGLYIVCVKSEINGEIIHNGCIINTLMQVTSTPCKVSITISKDNYTTKLIEESGEFNISILDESASFDLIKRFGFQSGRDVDKFDGFNDYKVSSNGVRYVVKSTNAYMSAKVVDKVDVGTHITFIAEITEEEILSTNKSLTYSFYHENIKPKATVNKKSYVCQICGYVYEGDELPSDFVCPLCKHGASDFVLQE